MSTIATTASPGMTPEQILGYEARWRPRIAVIAGVAAVLLMVGALLQLTGPHPKVNELTLGLIAEHKRIGRDVAGAILTGLGNLGVGAVVFLLWNSARARNPQTQAYIRVLAAVGAVVSAIAGIIGWIEFGHASNQFLSDSAQNYQQANHLMSASGLTVPGEVAYAGDLLLAVAIVLFALQAMRAGLLTRFMGYFGMLVGVLFLFPLIPIPAVQCYWLGALAYLLSGRWPTGVPKAWMSGKAEPWPSSQELREQRIRAQGAKGGGRAKPVPEPVGAGASQSASSGAAPASSTRTSTRTGQKRKRKRRK